MFPEKTVDAEKIQQNVIIAPLVYDLKQANEQILFPEIKPYDEGFLQVSKLHKLWYAQYGNPQGIPVVVVHGGPGAGCIWEMRFFDPAFYRIILFDQRGARRSLPFGEVRDNTTGDLISDMEKLRVHLHIKQWMLFGGSWGSTLSIAYGEAHPSSCLGFLLRGIFLAREQEWRQIWYGMGDLYPEAYDAYVRFIPEQESGDLIAAYARRLNNADPEIHMAAAKAFMRYDLAAAFSLITPNDDVLKDEKFLLGVARMFAAFSQHGFYLRENQLIDDLPKITHLPLHIVHGRFDAITRPAVAYELHQKWPGATLTFVPDAGHSLTHPGMVKALVQITQQLKDQFKKK